jgi:hypothetical protein
MFCERQPGHSRSLPAAARHRRSSYIRARFGYSCSTVTAFETVTYTRNDMHFSLYTGDVQFWRDLSATRGYIPSPLVLPRSGFHATRCRSTKPPA